MKPARVGALPSEVVIIRSGYPSESSWRTAIAAALGHGRAVRAIDASGQTRHLEPAGRTEARGTPSEGTAGPIQSPSAPLE